MPYQNRKIIRSQQGKWVTTSFCIEAPPAFCNGSCFHLFKFFWNSTAFFFSTQTSHLFSYPLLQPPWKRGFKIKYKSTVSWFKLNAFYLFKKKTTTKNKHTPKQKKSHPPTPTPKSKTLMANMELGGKAISSSDCDDFSQKSKMRLHPH